MISNTTRLLIVPLYFQEFLPDREHLKICQFWHHHPIQAMKIYCGGLRQ